MAKPSAGLRSFQLPCDLQDDAIHSTYQNRFEPQVQPVKPPMPPEPTSHPQHPTKDPPGRPWEVHRLPTGHYQWLGDRVKQALLLLALLGLVVQLCTLQPYRGPGSSPFGPKIGRQAPQPRLYQVRALGRVVAMLML